MAAEFLAGGQRLLEIDASSDLQRTAAPAERSFAHGFAGEVGGERAVIDGGDREAATVHRDTVGDRQLRGERGRVNGDAAAFVAQRERFDSAEVLDNSGEHCDIEDNILPRPVWSAADLPPLLRSRPCSACCCWLGL